jgi:Zn-dependent M28 family amino/carboxypeptidase
MCRAVLVSLIALALAACQSRHSPAPGAAAPAAAHVVATSATPPPMAVALAPQINEADFLRFDKTLASDAFGGRRPGTRGETLTTRYLIEQLRGMHLAPGNRGYWLQSVPAVATRLLNTHVRLWVTTAAGTQSFAYATDMMVATQQARSYVALRRSPVVFVGYGIDAPQWQWNDYAGASVKGKTIIVLADNPRFAMAGPQAFNGRGLTWYGLAAYKFEQAARMGAAACFVIQSGATGVPWELLRRGDREPHWSLAPGVTSEPRLAVAGWLTQAAAERLFRAAGLDLDTLTKQAGQPGFQAVPLQATASITLRNSIVHLRSNNVLALLRGAKHPDQVVIYSAHWDHLGVADDARGRKQVFHGAIDNGSGLAALLEIADAFAHQKSKPERSVLFLMPTLSEAGLLGSRYYAAHPVFPLAKTVADLNIDTWPVIGRARDMTVIGAGQSELEDDLRQVLALEGRTISPETTAQSRLYFRSDQLSFARAGVPALIVGPGLDLVNGGRAAGLAAAAAYMAHRYRKPGDVFESGWDLSGTLEDIETLYLLGRNLADSQRWPDWYADSIYRARRDAMMSRPAAMAPSAATARH